MPNPPSTDPRLDRRRASDEELDREAEITPADIDDAISQFNKDASGPFKGMLEADSDDDG